MSEFNLTINENRFNQLQSTDLKISLAKMRDAIVSMNSNQWDYAIQLHNIVVNQYYKPDFKTMSDFAKAFGIDKSTVSRYVSAVRVMVNYITPDSKGVLTMENIPYSKAARLGAVQDVRDFMNVSGIDLLACSVRELEKAIKEYKSGLENAETVNAEKQDEKPEKADETKEVETPSFTGRYDKEKVWFEIDGVQYIIPIKKLATFKKL